MYTVTCSMCTVASCSTSGARCPAANQLQGPVYLTARGASVCACLHLLLACCLLQRAALVEHCVNAAWRWFVCSCRGIHDGYTAGGCKYLPTGWSHKGSPVIRVVGAECAQRRMSDNSRVARLTDKCVVSWTWHTTAWRQTSTPVQQRNNGGGCQCLRWWAAGMVGTCCAQWLEPSCNHGVVATSLYQPSNLLQAVNPAILSQHWERLRIPQCIIC